MIRFVCLLTASLSLAGLVAAAPAAPLGALAKMPVKEVTIFKDGHAFVLHEGMLPTDAEGHVLLDYLPTPVVGTFWPYAGEKSAKLSGVTAGRRRVTIERTAMTVREVLEANIGAAVVITEVDGTKYPATLLAIPQISAEEMAAMSDADADDVLPRKADIILLKTKDGTKALPIERVRDVAVKDPLKTRVTSEEFRNLLTLKLDWGRARPDRTAEVGLVYLQKGIRWIPSYRITLDGQGNARVKLQATLINELTNLENVTANLVVGVPSFTFKDLVDPIALQQTTTQLSQSFRAEQNSRSAYAFSNAMMSQVASPETNNYQPRNSGDAEELGPEIGGTQKAEDLFVYTVKSLTLKRGERLAVPIAEFTLKYKDIYALDVPFAPPQEISRGFNPEQQRELARLMNAPKVLHRIRLINDSAFPITTAPAMLFLKDRLLAQTMTKYTAPGGAVELEATPAIDIPVKKAERETGRTPNAITLDDLRYTQVDLRGTITLTNRRNAPIDVEVTRYVLGKAVAADHNGVITMTNVQEDDAAVPTMTDDAPSWWRWYSWPGWWNRVNGVGRITWTVHLEPNIPTVLGYDWRYYWR